MSQQLTKKRLISIILCAVVLGFFFIKFSQPIKPTLPETQNPVKTEVQTSKPRAPSASPLVAEQIKPKATIPDTTQTVTPKLQTTNIKKPNSASSIHYKLTEKQKENLANEIEITEKGWLIYPYKSKDADGKPLPVLKYVPHLDNQGNFHSVSIYDMSVQPAFQLTHAYPIPYTSDFPPITLQKAKKGYLNSFRGRNLQMKYQNKLVWRDDKFTPYYLFECQYSDEYKEKNKRFPNRDQKFDCLVNAYTGY